MPLECQTPAQARTDRARGPEQPLGTCPSVPGSHEVLDPVFPLPFGLRHILFLTYCPT